MKRSDYRRYRKMQMMQDTLIVFAPPILMLAGVLWFFRNDWVPLRVDTVFMSFVDSFLALLRSSV